MSHRLETTLPNGERVAFIRGVSLQWCRGYIHHAQHMAPRNPIWVVQERDGKTIHELPGDDDVSVGMIAGFPTAGQYRRAAARAIERAEAIERWESKEEARQAARKEACLWTYHDSHGGEWRTACGASYDAADFGCSSIRKCMSCGKPTTTKLEGGES